MNFHLWSWLLTAIGVTALYLTGRRLWIGWAVGLCAQALWAVYVATTGQWGFLPSVAIYACLYVRNLRAWRRLGRQPVADSFKDSSCACANSAATGAS